MLQRCFLILVFFLSSLGLAQTPENLEEIALTVQSANFRSEVIENRISLDSIALNRSLDLNLSDNINRISGVMMQSGALNTNRITIRGIGARIPYGTSKLRMYYNDVPLTDASGNSNLDDFEMGSLDKINIFKGAQPIDFGAGLGGSIQLISSVPKKTGTRLKNQITLGSYDLIKSTTGFYHSNNKNHFKIIYSHTSREGYRDNSQYFRETLTYQSEHLLSKSSKVSFFGAFSELYAHIPSALNKDDFINNPSAAAPSWASNKGFEDTNRFLVSAALNTEINSSLSSKTIIFANNTSSYEPRPFNILSTNLKGLGLRQLITDHTFLNNLKLKFITGLELLYDQQGTTTYENLYQTNNSSNPNLEGNPLFKAFEKRSYLNLFSEIQYQLNSRSVLVFGANYNKSNYLFENLSPLESTTNYSIFRNNKGVISPKLAFNYKLNPNVVLSCHVSHGFAAVPFNGTQISNQFSNPLLKPETGWTYEFKSHSEWIHKRLIFDFSMYHMQLKNLLLTEQTPQDDIVYKNAGLTHQNGIESSVKYVFLNKNGNTIESFINTSLHQYKFKSFQDHLGDYSGNDVTGVPKHTFSIGVDLSSKIGFYTHVNMLNVGPIPMTDNNSLYNEAYTILDWKFGYQNNLSKKVSFHGYFGINNASDQSYARQILVNAKEFGASKPRFYYPGDPMNYYLSFSLKYLF